MVIPRTVKVLFLFFLVFCGNGQLTFADNFNHRNEADRILTLTHLYQIETIDSLLQAIFKENPTDQGINPLQINFLLFQTGRKTLAIQNLQIHYNYLSNNALPSEIIQFLKLYSVLLEEMGQSENALSLWKELAKKMCHQEMTIHQPSFSPKLSEYTTIKNLMTKRPYLKSLFKTHRRKILMLM